MISNVLTDYVALVYTFQNTQIETKPLSNWLFFVIEGKESCRLSSQQHA